MSETSGVLNTIKNVYSTILLIFSIVLVAGLIFTEQTRLSKDVHPALAFIVMWIAVFWLSIVEGGQASFVGLAPIKTELYQETHPLAYKSCKICHTGDNLDRYLLGRQFMVVLIVFIVNFCGAPLSGAELWGLPQWITDIFLVTGFAMILFTCMVGQLNSQVNAAHCMLDYVNNFLNLFTFYVAMAIEFSGLLHASYLIQFLVAALAGKPIVSKEEEKPIVGKLFFWFRCLMSLAILIGCLAVTFEALFTGKTTMWEGVPGVVAVILFFGLMSVIGMLEGMQIAFFAVAKLTKEERGESKFAKMTCDLLFKGEGRNLPGFMIGRQLTVVSCFFIVARVTSLDIAKGEENVFGVSDSLQEFFNLGFLGAFITTILGSISWQLVAGAFPIAFLSNPFTYILLRIALLLEATGLCSGAWVLAAIHAKIAGFQRDEVYIGTAEERANKGEADGDSVAGVGHMTKLPGFADNAPAELQELMKTDPAVAAYIESIRETGKVDEQVAEQVVQVDLEAGDATEVVYRG